MTPQQVDEIATNYKAAPTFRLVRLAENPDGLPADVVPALQKELLSRGEHDAALLLTHYLISSKKQQEDQEKVQESERYQALTPAEIRQEITQRLAAGESMESIVLKFKDNGIDIHEQMEEQRLVENNILDYILALKQKGLNDEAVDEKMKTDLSIDQTEVEVLKEKLHQNGRLSLIVGIVSSLGALTAMLLLQRITIAGLIILAVGIWRIIEGHRAQG